MRTKLYKKRKRFNIVKMFRELTFKKVLFWTPVVLTAIVLFINAISLLYPVLWGLNMSFKDIIAYTIEPNKLTTEFHFENYTNIASILHVQILTNKGILNVGFNTMLRNTLVWAILSPLPSAIFGILVPYVIAIYQNAFTKFLYNLGIVLMCLVVVGTFPAQYAFYAKLNMYDNMFLQIILSPRGCFSGFGFLLYYNIYKGVPKDYADAARIDGAGHWQTFFVAYLPHIFSLALMYYIMAVLGAWNDYSTFLIWLPSYPNLTYGVYLFQFEAKTNGATLPEIIAAFFVVALPTIIFYLFMDKQLVAKLKVTGLKG